MSFSVSHLVKRFPEGTVALDGVSLRAERGERVALLGPNGSGKSTLMKCLVRLEEPTSGSVSIGGEEIMPLRGRALSEVRRKVGMVSQRFDLVENLSVFHNVLLGSLGRGGVRRWHPAIAPEGERRRVMGCLMRVGLEGLAKRRADTLSGGQRQRVAIARMLMQDPELILADEPVASLDPRAGRGVMDLLWEICGERRMTMVCALHQLDLALEYSERILALQDGSVVLDRPTAQVDRAELERLYEGQPGRGESGREEPPSKADARKERLA